MTQIIPHGSAPLVQTGPTLDLAAISQWAKVFVDSGMFKDSKSLAQAIVKIQAGQELGLPPFAAMRGFDVIEGKPAPNAGLTAALIKRSGRYDYRIVRSDATACVLEWTDSGHVVGQSSFTIEEAKVAGLTRKPVWVSYATDLLFARSLTRGGRRYCADLFLGSIYTAEELGADDSDSIGHEPMVTNMPSGRAFAAPEPEFNGPGSFTGATDAEFTAAVAAEPEPSDDPAEIASWKILIDEADTFADVVNMVNRIGKTEKNPYRAGGALRLAAARMIALLPVPIKPEEIQKHVAALHALGSKLDPDNGKCAVTKASRDAHDDARADVAEAAAHLLTLHPPADVATIEDGEL